MIDLSWEREDLSYLVNFNILYTCPYFLHYKDSESAFWFLSSVSKPNSPRPAAVENGSTLINIAVMISSRLSGAWALWAVAHKCAQPEVSLVCNSDSDPSIWEFWCSWQSSRWQIQHSLRSPAGKIPNQLIADRKSGIRRTKANCLQPRLGSAFQV